MRRRPAPTVEVADLAALEALMPEPVLAGPQHPAWQHPGDPQGRHVLALSPAARRRYREALGAFLEDHGVDATRLAEMSAEALQARRRVECPDLTAEIAAAAERQRAALQRTWLAAEEEADE